MHKDGAIFMLSFCASESTLLCVVIFMLEHTSNETLAYYSWESDTANHNNSITGRRSFLRSTVRACFTCGRALWANTRYIAYHNQFINIIIPPLLMLMCWTCCLLYLFPWRMAGREGRKEVEIMLSSIVENTLSFLPLSLSAARSRSCAAAMRKHPELDNEAAELSGTGNTSESIN